jgi:glutamyl-tRNA reductase
MVHLDLQTLAFVGTSHRRVGFERLGEFVLPSGQREPREALREALEAEELVYLATCNRVECYLVSRNPSSPAALRARFRAHFESLGATIADDELEVCQGAEALRHAFSVTASLKSLVVGETEIAGQMRRAWQEAADWGVAGPRLQGVHDRAQACARRIRNTTGVGSLRTSVGTLAVQKILQHFSQGGPRLSVLLGVGTMTVKTARALERFPGERVFVNRTLARAEELASRFGGRAMALGEFLAQPPAGIDLLMSATSAPDVVVRAELLAEQLQRRADAGGPPMIVCDLGVPRDVDPRLDSQPGVRVVTMAAVEALARVKRERLAGELAQAETVLDEAVEKLALESRFTALATTSTQAMLARRLSHVSEEDQAVILRFAQQLASRMARQPQLVN